MMMRTRLAWFQQTFLIGVMVMSWSARDAAAQAPAPQPQPQPPSAPQPQAPSAPPPQAPSTPPAAPPAAPPTGVPLSAPSASPTNAPVTPGPAVEPAPAPPAAEPAPAPPAAQPVPAPAAPAEAPALVAAEPTPSEPARTPLSPPPMQADTWTTESRLQRSPLLYRGLSLRLSAELGLARADRELPVGKTKVSGLEGGISIDVGGAVADDFIVYGRVAGFAFNHAFKSDSPNVGTAYYGLVGAGARYHFMPIDWYASGTLGLVAMSVTGDLNQVENAAPGFGLQLETGKNWLSGADDGHGTIGLGLRLTYARCGSVGGISDPWVTLGVSGVFSVAYN